MKEIRINISELKENPLASVTKLLKSMGYEFEFEPIDETNHTYHIHAVPAATSSIDETKKKSVLIDTSKRAKENLMMEVQLAVHDLGLNDKIKFAFLRENPDIVRISRIDEGEEPQQAAYTYF